MPSKSEKIKLADEMTRDGYTAEEIAKRLGVTSRTVKNWRKKTGAKSPHSGRPKGSKCFSPRQYEEDVSFLRPGPRPADMQFGISDEQLASSCRSAYDQGRLKPEFKNQVDLPKRIK